MPDQIMDFAHHYAVILPELCEFAQHCKFYIIYHIGYEFMRLTVTVIFVFLSYIRRKCHGMPLS